MQYLIFTSSSNLSKLNVLKNVTDTFLDVFACSQIMCVSWLTFFPCMVLLIGKQELFPDTWKDSYTLFPKHYHK